MIRKTWLKCLLLLSLGSLLSFSLRYNSAAKSLPQVSYQIDKRASYTAHLVTIPASSGLKIVPALENELTSIADFADKYDAIAAINGGYFDPVNQKTTSYIVREAKIVADPRFNERLVDNPDLKQYLGKILNRAEFRRYSCGEKTQYDIQLHSAPIPSNCTLKDALGGGPRLLPQDSSVAEAFTAYKDGEKIRDAIGFDSPNARSAIAIRSNGDVVLVMVAQQANVANSGISLPDLASYLSALNVTKAMNLDGGSSSSIYVAGKTAYGKLDKTGKEIARNIKSVLLVTQK